jgi:cytochrome b6-f complex iron-sulfur subunit
MAQKKLTTAEILAQARQQGAIGAAGGGPRADGPAASDAADDVTPDAQPQPAASVESTASEAPAAEPERPPKPPAAKPSSTADILAAARAQGSTQAEGGKKAATDKKPAAAARAAKPGSTADILAAARAAGGGGAAKPAAAAKPVSTADILAAARAGGAGTEKPSAKAGESKKSAETKSSPKPPAARPPGNRPSVQEMVKAARDGARPAVQTAPPKPKLPSRPPLPAKAPSGAERRRSFIGSAIVRVTEPLTAAWAAMIAIGGVWSLATARFMMPNMIVEPPTKFKIGPASDYPPSTVSTKWKAERGIWVVNTDQYDGRSLIYALASVCTHLGCTPNWLEGEQKFKCPCHGSGFYITGVNFEGPAPRPLERVGIRLAEDGSLEVDKSVKFQEELGQWQDPASFVEMA